MFAAELGVGIRSVNIKPVLGKNGAILDDATITLDCLQVLIDYTAPSPHDVRD